MAVLWSSLAETVYLSDSWEKTNIYGVVGKAKDKSGEWYHENPKAISSKRNKCVMLFKKLMCVENVFLAWKLGGQGMAVWTSSEVVTEA